jgi:hypothetical protein
MWPSGPTAGTVPGGGTAADAVAGGVTAAGGMAAAGYVAADGPGPATDAFHQEVLRTTADLDAMLALAGVTGAGVGAHFDDYDMPEVPDTPEGVDRTDEPATPEHADRAAGAGPDGAARPSADAARPSDGAAQPSAGAAQPSASAAQSSADADAGAREHAGAGDGGLPIRDPAVPATPDTTADMDDTAIIAGGARRPE